MKYFIFSILLSLLACESINEPKNKKKDKNVKMEITTEPSIKVKK